MFARIASAAAQAAQSQYAAPFALISLPCAATFGASAPNAAFPDVYKRQAFVLLLFIGGNMIREGLSKEEEKANDSFSFGTMAVLAVATSIDALAVGVTFALLPGVNLSLIHI